MGKVKKIVSFITIMGICITMLATPLSANEIDQTDYENATNIEHEIINPGQPGSSPDNPIIGDETLFPPKDANLRAYGWNSNSTGWWYEYDNAGHYYINSWAIIGGVWYYFNGNGYMVTGWQQIGSKWYYFTGSGAMCTGWVQVLGKTYFLTADGSMATYAWITEGNDKYYVDGNGVWVKSQGIRQGSITDKMHWCPVPDYGHVFVKTNMRVTESYTSNVSDSYATFSNRQLYVQMEHNRPDGVEGTFSSLIQYMQNGTQIKSFTSYSEVPTYWPVGNYFVQVNKQNNESYNVPKNSNYISKGNATAYITTLFGSGFSDIIEVNLNTK